MLLRGCRSNDVVFKSFLTVLLLPLQYSLFLRVKSFKVQSDFFLFFAEWLAETLPVIIFKGGGGKSSSGVCRNNLWKKDTCKWSVLSLESVKQLWNSLCRFPDIIFRTVGPQSDFFSEKFSKIYHSRTACLQR